MPDITMCPGHECPRKEECYRFLAKPDQRQSYFTTPPFKWDSLAPAGYCPHFVQADEEERRRSMKDYAL